MKVYKIYGILLIDNVGDGYLGTLILKKKLIKCYEHCTIMSAESQDSRHLLPSHI